MDKKVAIIIICYNRPRELAECLMTIKMATIHSNEISMILLIDDASGDAETKRLIRDFYVPCSGYYRQKVTVIKMLNRRNEGICPNLIKAYDFCFDNEYDVVMNFDSDAKVKLDIFDKLLALHEKFHSRMVTGFHSQTKNRDGSDRRKIISMHEQDGYCIKDKIGGINLVVNKCVYETYMRPVLQKNSYKGWPGPGDWDHQVSLAMHRDMLSPVSAVPSLIQHTALSSTLGHDDLKPDIAEDWRDLYLPDVTLIAVDEWNIEGMIAAAYRVERNIEFGDVKLISNYNHLDKQVLKVGYSLKRKEDYSRFILKELHKYIDTGFALLIQHGKYTINYKGWNNEFLEYDYVGVNNGFSLRSKKLMEVIAADAFMISAAPEHQSISDHYRSYLERTYQLKFAPEGLATRFADEIIHVHEASPQPSYPVSGIDVFIRRHPPELTTSRFLKK